MTVMMRQIRTLVTEVPLRTKKNATAPNDAAATNKNKARTPKRSLTVKISKDPPAIVYFERDTLEDSFECIFDPKVHHDDEKDHPDLLVKKFKNTVKPWQKPPYGNNTPSLMSRLKSTFGKNSTLL